MKILVSGAAGFIGFHLARSLTGQGHDVVGIDNVNDYYDPALKWARCSELGIRQKDVQANSLTKSTTLDNYRFIKASLEEKEIIQSLFDKEQFDIVCHLAAQPGVRYSIENPYAYINSNVVGFLNILEACRHHTVRHLVYASSSSVYGLNEKVPFSTSDNIDHPVSLYAATKKSNELMAHTYSHLYGIPTTGLRFFTVYGPWGRPDMAYSLFADAILHNKPIKIFNNGQMYRDFTYISDIISGIYKVLERAPEGNKNWSGEHPDPASSRAPYRVFNIGNGAPVDLMKFVEVIEQILGREAKKIMMPMQAGDVVGTYADIQDLKTNFDYTPKTSVEEGLKITLEWHKKYYMDKVVKEKNSTN